jgi:hypothetical protein
MKTKLKIYFISLISIIGLSACDVKSTDDGSNTTASSALSYEVLDGGGVNQFFVHLKMPDDSTVSLRRLHGENLDFEVVAATDYTDKTAQAGESYQYLIGHLHNSKFVSTQQISVDMPSDLYVKGVVSIDTDKQAKQLCRLRNLIFFPDSVLITSGRDLVIKADKIQSQQGTIETFAAGSTAAVATSGRSGGNLVIQSNQAEGLISIFMRGENGGQGAQGTPIGPGRPAGSGGVGGNGGDSGELHLATAVTLKVEVKHEVGAAGGAGAGGFGGPNTVCGPDDSRIINGMQSLQAMHCYSMDVHPGYPGAPGNPGQFGKTCFVEQDGSEECTPGN